MNIIIMFILGMQYYVDMPDTATGKEFDTLDEFLDRTHIGPHNMGLYLRSICKSNDLHPHIIKSSRIFCGSVVDGSMDAKVKGNNLSPVDIDMHAQYLIDQDSFNIEDVPDNPGYVYITKPLGTQLAAEDHVLYYEKYNKMCLSSIFIKTQFARQTKQKHSDICHIDTTPRDASVTLQLHDSVQIEKEKTSRNPDSVECAGTETLDLGNIDCVFAIPFWGWPKIAKSWLLRQRHWPEPKIVLMCATRGYHLIPKALVDTDVEWRYSFSVAETILMHSMSDNQWKCYYICKSLLSKNIVSHALTTYHLKTVLFWKCESLPSFMWNQNLGKAVVSIIDDLIHAFASQHLPHYFIQEQNLLQKLPLEAVKGVVKELLHLREKLTSKLEIGNSEKSTLYDGIFVSAHFWLWILYRFGILINKSSSSDEPLSVWSVIDVQLIKFVKYIFHLVEQSLTSSQCLKELQIMLANMMVDTALMSKETMVQSITGIPGVQDPATDHIVESIRKHLVTFKSEISILCDIIELQMIEIKKTNLTSGEHHQIWHSVMKDKFGKIPVITERCERGINDESILRKLPKLLDLPVYYPNLNSRVTTAHIFSQARFREFMKN